MGSRVYGLEGDLSSLSWQKFLNFMVEEVLHSIHTDRLYVIYAGSNLEFPYV